MTSSGAVFALLGGLEDDFIGAAKLIGMRFEQAGDIHAAGGMRVVAAAVIRPSCSDL